MNVVKHRKVVIAWLVIVLLSSTLTTCGTLELGVERTPTPDHAATATVSALATENARLTTQVATLAVPTSTPTPSLGKLAYVQGGDIWVKALPDGEPQRLTTDGRNSIPRWSPSGKWIAFRKGEYRQVWAMHADGSDARSLQTPPNVAFAWSPVADRLAYADGDRLKVVNADGTDPATLVAGPSVMPPTPPPLKENTVGRIAWSADGAWIAYEWYEKEPKGPLAYQGLWRVSSDGEQLAELYVSGAPEKGEAILAGWSLDGQHILFWQGDILSASMLADGVALYSLPASGGDPIKLADTVLVHDDFLAPVPQGDRLAVTSGGYRATWTNKRVAVVGAGGGELTWLTDESVAAFSPAWSPDGVHLAYVAMPDEGDLVGGDDARLGMMERRVWVINAKGKPQQLTDDPAYRDERPRWSADGSHLLFARMDAEGRASMWLIPAAGGEPRRVLDELTPLPGPAPGWFGYYGYVEWDQLFDWWRGPARALAGVMVPTPGPPPTATIVLTATRTYTDTALGFAIDYPADWDVDGVQGALVWLSNPATSDEERQAINIVTLAESSLEAMLDNVEQGSTETIIDCTDVYPGLPGCLRQESLVGGRLAFVDSRPPFDGRPTVIDLEGGGMWMLGDSPAWLYSWSPSGNSLLVGGADVPTAWHYDGQNHNPISSTHTLFWAPRSSFEGGEEQLAIVAKDGSLIAAYYTASDSTVCGERLLLPPGSLGDDGRGTVRWSPDGWLAWSLNTDQLATAGQWEQTLYIRPVEGEAETTAWCLSDDIREAYYQIMDWVPGTRLILAARGMMAISLWSWGVPLVTINADTGEITDLDAAMLLTPEAYAWHPTQPGLLALAEGGSRYLFETGHLALLDVTSGKLTYLTGEDVAAFEPAWSPDGTLLAYAAVPASPDASGDGTTLEHTLDGRAIYVVNPQGGETHALTHPDDAVDGWPQWSADGTRLLYTRQHDGYTDVRVVTLDGSSDQLLVTGLPDPTCYYGGCGWWQMLAYYPGP
jgi:Tol biopolymer transport system component